MSLPHALLTSLSECSGAGSELARRFDRSIGHFWHATHQQIYRELRRLESAGLIESLPPESGRGRRRVYRIKPAGRRELRRWLGSAAEPMPLRHEMMLRLRAEAVVGPTALDAQIRRQLAHHQRMRDAYLAIEARDFGQPDADRTQAIQHLILSAGIEMERFWIDTYRKALELMARTETP